MKLALAALHALHADSDLNFLKLSDLLLIIFALKSSAALWHGIQLHVLLKQAWACFLSNCYAASIILILSLYTSLVMIGIVQGYRRSMNLHLLHALPLGRLLHHMHGLDFGCDFLGHATTSHLLNLLLDRLLLL